VYTDMHSEQILPGYTVLVTCSSAASLHMRITINICLLSRSLYLLKRGQQFRYNVQVYRGVHREGLGALTPWKYVGGVRVCFSVYFKRRIQPKCGVQDWKMWSPKQHFYFKKSVISSLNSSHSIQPSSSFQI